MPATAPISQRVRSAKENPEELNILLKDYTPFIRSVLSDHQRQFTEGQVDDLLTTGMLAFQEAVMAYDENKGNFLSFARRIIALCAIDQYRKENSRDVALKLQDEQEEKDHPAIVQASVDIHEKAVKGQDRKEDILRFQAELSQWGIDMTELEKKSPRKKDLRKVYKQAAKALVADAHLLEEMKETQKLPLAQIALRTGIHRKKLERGRIYIVALVLICSGDYDTLQEWIGCD